MARYKFTRADCALGGWVRSKMPDFPELCIKGYEATMRRHGRDAAVKICRKRSGRRP